MTDSSKRVFEASVDVVGAEIEFASGLLVRSFALGLCQLSLFFLSSDGWVDLHDWKEENYDGVSAQVFRCGPHRQPPAQSIFASSASHRCDGERAEVVVGRARMKQLQDLLMLLVDE